MIYLAIEASNKTLSVALFQHTTLLSEVVRYNTLQHSVHLVPALETVLKKANVSMQQIQKIIVSNGPGSYTGLRIGVTLAKTLGYTLNVPVIPVSSLRVLSVSHGDESVNESKIKGKQDGDHCIVSFFDARRSNVFIGCYQNGQAIIQDNHIAMAAFLNQINDMQIKVSKFVSPDMVLYREQILEQFPNAVCVEQVPLANAMGNFHNEPIVSTHLLQPYYLKLAEAEEVWQKNQPQLANHDINEWVERISY